MSNLGTFGLILQAAFMSALLALPLEAREQSQMNHPAGPPPTQAIGARGMQSMNMVPAVSPNFWTQQMEQSLPPGTVISGILQADLASHKSQPGEQFEILIVQPLVNNGREVIPANSKITGEVVSAAPAKSLHHGHPGRLDVAIKNLVMPDGRTAAISGFIDHNSNLDPQEEPQVRAAGHHISDWGKSVGAFFGSFTSGIGASMNRHNRGADFKLNQGAPVTVKLNDNLMIPPPATAGAPTYGGTPAYTGSPPAFAQGPAYGAMPPAYTGAPQSYTGMPQVAPDFAAQPSGLPLGSAPSMEPEPF